MNRDTLSGIAALLAIVFFFVAIYFLGRVLDLPTGDPCSGEHPAPQDCFDR